MALVSLRKKGQVSIEFILLVTIALVYINGVVWPVVESSSQAATDIKAMADTKVSAMRLANSINEASASSGDMKKTINIFMPENGAISCTAGQSQINYSVLVAYIGNWDPGNPGGWNPDESNCTMQLASPDPDERPDGFACGSSIDLLEDLDSDCPPMQGPLFRKLVVQKTGLTTSLSWE